MWNYRAQYSFSPLAIAVDLRLTPTIPLAQRQRPVSWQWQYQFKDGSQLQGLCQGYPTVSSPESTPSKALPSFHVQQVGMGEYLATDEKTCLLQWQPAQFTCYELGTELLLMASNDNYVGNSFCLVNAPHRQWAQVTHWGSQLVAEPFAWERFTMQCLEPTRPSGWQISWQVSPLFAPFFQWHLAPVADYESQKDCVLAQSGNGVTILTDLQFQPRQ